MSTKFKIDFDELQSFDVFELANECNNILPIELPKKREIVLGLTDGFDFYDDKTEHFEIDAQDFYANYVPRKGGVTSFELYNIFLDPLAPVTQFIQSQGIFMPSFTIHLTVFWTGQTKRLFGADIPQGLILRKEIKLVE